MLLLAALLAMASPAPAAPAPETIYFAALRRLEKLPQPAYIDQTSHRIMVQETPKGNIPGAFDERVFFDSKRRRECVFVLPYSGTSQVLISRSYFAPDMWLLHPAGAVPAVSTVPASAQTALPAHTDFAPDLSDLKTIASVMSKPSYHIRLAGVDKLSNGGTAYHLVLAPDSDPKLHNLRELWINSKTFDIMRAVIVGQYAPDPRARVEPATVAEDFGKVGPYWVVIHHTWTYDDMLDHVTIRFDDTATKMRFPASIPPWYFERDQFDAHRSEVDLTSPTSDAGQQ